MSGKMYTTEEFVARAKAKHGDKYEYDKTTYTGANKKLVITCPVHGDFEQIANAHMKGSGCQKCVLEKRGTKHGL
jgi:hypothetical protein